MKKLSLARQAVVIAPFLLAVCAEVTAHETKHCRDLGLSPLGLFVEGVPVEQLAASITLEQRNTLVRGMGLPDDKGEIVLIGPDGKVPLGGRMH